MQYNKNDNYPFLNDRLLREPHILEVINEIDAMQKRWLKNRTGELATLEQLNQSRNIKVPLTQKRIQNIQYLLEQLVKFHPDEIKPAYSFSFEVNPENKNLSIHESLEYTLLMKESDFSQLQAQRDEDSTKNIIDLLSKFRLFNLSKLIKKSKNRNHLTLLIKNQLGKELFTFKTYLFDKNGFEKMEDYCFHKSNHDAVRKKIDLEVIRKITNTHAAAINRRLKSFGILNSTVSDYRDSKLDYLINILTGDMAPALDKKDIMDVKNLKSLRDCISKVDKILDPLKLLENDIYRQISDSFIITETDLLSKFEELTPENFTQWEAENSGTGRVLINRSGDGLKYIIDSAQFLSRYREIIQLIIYNSDIFNTMADTERDDKTFLADILTESAKKIIARDQQAVKIFKSEDAVYSVKQLIKEYEEYKETKVAYSYLNNESANQGKQSVIIIIINAFRNIFSKRENKSIIQSSTGKKPAAAESKKAGISRETRDVFKQIKNLSSQLIALSDFIEIKPENEQRIDQIINDLRSNNLKIVIPIYNARQVLYPVRSKKYLMADVEYILVDTEITKTPEAIRDFTDSIAGYKFKEDGISGNALFCIEKYLMTINRQHRAKMKRAKSAR